MPSVIDAIGLDQVNPTDLRLGLVAIALLYWLQRYIQQWREFKVICFCPIHPIFFGHSNLLVQADSLFGEQHGCRPMESRYPCKWPLGLDILSAQYKANAEKRLLAFQQPYLDDLGPNLELKILGTVGYTTYDPENVEAILSTRFEGPSSGSFDVGIHESN